MAKPREPVDTTVTLTPAVPPAKRRRGRKVLAVFAVLVVGLAALVWFAPAVAARSSLRDSILHAATAKVNGTVTVGDVSLGWLHPIELTDVRVTDPDGRDVLAAPSVRTSYTLLALATNRADLGTIIVDRPTLTVVCGDRTNLEDVLARLLTREAANTDRPAVTVEVTGARVLLADKGGTPAPVLENGTATVTVPRESDRPVTVTANADAAGGPGRAEAAVTIGPTVGVAAKTTDFPLDGLGPLVRRFVPGTRVAGRATADLTIRVDATVAVAGRAEVAGLDLTSPLIGPDRVRLARATLPCNVTISGDTVAVGEGTELDCDVGKVTVAGTFSPSDTPETIAARHGLKATADVDVAKLAALVPKLLRVREGTTLSSGHVRAEVASVAGPRGIGWKGKVETTALRGTRDGKPIAWDQPLLASFDAHLRPDGLPEFDDLQCQSEFVSFRVRGSVSEFVAAANLDLSHLSARLGQFVDFGGVTLAGTGSLTANLQHGKAPDEPDGLNARLDLTNFVYRDAAGHGLNEPKLSLTLSALGRFGPTGPVPVSLVNVQVNAGPADRFTLTSYQPVADVRTAHTGKLRVKLAGDMGRWRSRVGPFAGLPPEWVVGGNGVVDTQVDLAADAIRCPKVTANVTGLRFRGLGLNVSEQQPAAFESGAAYDRKTGAVALTDVRLSSETVGASARRIDAAPLAAGGWGAKGTLAVTANVGRVEQAVGLNADVTGLANGQVHFDIGAGGVVGFDTALTGENLVVGPPQQPLWTEARAKLNAAGAWDPAADGVRFDKLHVERDGLTADARGSATKVSSPAAAVDVAGTLAYDLAKLEPQLRAYLGPGAKAVGNEVKPFKLSGRLGDGGKNLAVAVGGANPRFDQLTGSAAVGWQQVRAYGFEVGPAELTAGLDKGTVSFSPVKASFGGGSVDLSPKLRLDSGYDLSFAPGRVVTKAKLTPAACANAVGFVLPPLANAAEVEGLVSLDLAENTVPLADPTKMNVRGTVMVHNATVSAGPLFTEIATALQAKNTTFTLTQEQAVPFRVENGRVFHDSFTVKFEQTAVRTSGSVGLDGTLALFVDVQVPPRLAQQLFTNNPVAREALAKQTLRFPVGGTLAKPKLDPRGFQAAVQKLTRDTTREAVGGLFKKFANPPDGK